MQTISRRVSSIFVTSPMLCIAFFLMIAALYYKNRDLSIVILFILCVGCTAKIWTLLGYRGIDIKTRIDKQRIFPGHAVEFDLTLANGTYLPVWCQAVIPLKGLINDSGNERLQELMGQTSLLWHDTARFQWKLAASRRGIYRPGPLSLTCGDLFGFFPREKSVDVSVEIVVYPRLIPLRSFSIVRRDFFGIPGDESPVRDPVYILGTHDYQFGRPARFMHWKASARHHILQEKVFEPTEQEKVFFLAITEEFEEAQAFTQFEQTLEVIASIAALLDQNGIAAGFATDASIEGNNTFYRSMRKDPGHLASILEILARMRMEKGRNLTETLRSKGDLPFGVTCLCFSYRIGKASRAAAEYFRQRRIPVIHYVCVNPTDQAPAAPNSKTRSVRAIHDLLLDKKMRLTDAAA